MKSIRYDWLGNQSKVNLCSMTHFPTRLTNKQLRMMTNAYHLSFQRLTGNVERAYACDISKLY